MIMASRFFSAVDDSGAAVAPAEETWPINSRGAPEGNKTSRLWDTQFTTGYRQWWNHTLCLGQSQQKSKVGLKN